MTGSSASGCSWRGGRDQVTQWQHVRMPADTDQADVLVDVRDEADGLCAFVDASPSPFHACATAVAALRAAGFAVLAERDAWPTDVGRYVVVRGGSLVAWSTERAVGPLTPYRIVGAHTDSPNLRIKPQPEFN